MIAAKGRGGKICLPFPLLLPGRTAYGHSVMSLRYFSGFGASIIVMRFPCSPDTSPFRLSFRAGTGHNERNVIRR